MIDDRPTDEMRADVMVKILEEPDGWSIMMSTLRAAVAEATEDTFGPMLETIAKKFGEDSQEAGMMRAAMERSLRSVSGTIAEPFSLVAGHLELSEDGATRFHVFLTVLARDMILKQGAKETVEGAMGVLRARFPRATSEERVVSLEVMDS